MTATERDLCGPDLPTAIADLIRRGEAEKAAAKAAAERAEREAAERRRQLTALMLADIRAAVVAADIGLTEELAETFLTVVDDDPERVGQNRYTTANLHLPGCERVSFNVAHSSDGVWQIGRDGESGPFHGPKPGYTGTHHYPTLAQAVAAAREVWLAGRQRTIRAAG